MSAQSIYTHKHHIIPRHAGGTDEPDNLVELTVEDHAIAHLVRYRIYGDDRDRVAAQMLSGQISGYDAFMEMVKRPKSEKWKKQMSERNSGEGNPFYGKKQSDKQKEAVRVANSVPKPHVADAQRKAYAEGKSNLCNRVGALNGKARKIMVDGVVYDTITECKAAGHKSVQHKLKLDNYPNWVYLD